MIDKREDIKVLSNLGADKSMIQRIFLYEGWMISTLGAVIGLVVGLVACTIQEYFGLLKLGSGTEYIISTYPVEVQIVDIILIGIVVIIIGFLAAWYPVRKLNIE
jgi:ABC-type lipoprotein release transport system permease subunit